MNVLFLMGRYGVGGVERVTNVLANEFISRGIRVCVFVFGLEDENLLSGLDNQVKFVQVSCGMLNKPNMRLLRETIVKYNITHVINQWAVPYPVTKFIRAACRGRSTKLVAVHHNLPNFNKKIGDSHGLNRLLWKFVSAVNSRLVYELSDRYVVLSQSFISILGGFIWRRVLPKAVAIPNPLTLCPAAKTQKENVILYVGRLEETQKRVSRLLDFWKHKNGYFPDWQLVIVGDGPDREAYHKMAGGIPRLDFVGWQDPSPYYAKARIIALTSDFEGFGLVLVEAMANRCVPVVLDSYAAAHDIVANGSDGVLVPLPWNVECYAKALSSAMMRYEEMSERAFQKSKNWNVNRIVSKWTDLLTSI